MLLHCHNIHEFSLIILTDHRYAHAKGAENNNCFFSVNNSLQHVHSFPSQQVMGTLGRVSFGGSLMDVRRASGSRGTPSLARSSPIVTSSSTISAGLDLDIDEIIAPPDDFSNGLTSMPSGEYCSGPE